MPKKTRESQTTLCNCPGYHRTHVYNRELCSPDPAKNKHQDANR